VPVRSPLTGVSVVIPVYNRPTLVPATLDSVLAQDWPRSKLEIVVVDDGSTDDTPTVLEAYRAEHPDVIRVVRQQNGGVQTARNTGVREARFPYVAFIDSDDRWATTKLSRQMELLAAEPDLEFVYTALADPSDGRTPGIVVQDWDPDPERALERLLIGDCIVPSSVLASRRLLTDAGLFEPTLRHGDDYDMWLKLAERGHRLAYLQEPLTIYLHHDGGSSRATAAVNRSLVLVLKRHLNSDALPTGLRKRRRWFLSHRYFNNGIASLECSDYRAAMREILRAAFLHPASIRPGWLRLLAQAIAGGLRSRA